MDRNELPHDPRHLGVPSGVPKMIAMPVVYSAQTMHLYCAEINTISKQTEMSFDLTLVPRSIIGCSQNDFRAYGTFGANYAPISRGDEHYPQTDQNKLQLDIHYLGVPSGCAQSDFHAPVTFGANRAPILRRD